MNHVTLIGHLGKDVESRETSNDGKMATMKLATSDDYKDKKSGEWAQVTDWHQVTTFAPGLVEILQKHG